MKKIVIIGAGQLGSRHLQGIAQSNIRIDIEVVEPFENSRIVAKQRYEEIEKNKHVNSIKFLENISELSDTLDLVIIATSANVRSQIIKELLEKKTVYNLVLEKVLFQTLEEYSNIDKLLTQHNVKCWVNHPRRMFPIYEKIKNLLQGSNQISYNVQGGDWGLGCNALHFIDHFSYLVDSSNLSVDNSKLNKELYLSKRDGFIEFNGLLTGTIDNHHFTLYSNEASVPLVFTIVSDMMILNIHEGENKIEIIRKENDWKAELIEDKIIYFQSELSNILIEDILIKNNCKLPKYKDAMALHVPFLKSLLEHMDKINGQHNKICPIT